MMAGSSTNATTKSIFKPFLLKNLPVKAIFWDVEANPQKFFWNFCLVRLLAVAWRLNAAWLPLGFKLVKPFSILIISLLTIKTLAFLLS
jgi:hypothetical protein